MLAPEKIAEALLDPILAAPRKSFRKLVAIAGPPASGKSTISDAIARSLTASGHNAQVVQMDGFHLDNAELEKLKLLHRKGAPQTFDAISFVALVEALSNDKQVAYPTFERSADRTVTDGGAVRENCDIAILEGNYLLLDAPIWRDLTAFWDLSIFVEIPTDVLRQRLINRWRNHGYSLSQASTRAEANDLKNAKQVTENSRKPDLIIRPDSSSDFILD